MNRRTVGTLFVLIGLPLVLSAALYARNALDDLHYAKRVFAPVVTYERVIASRRWHPVRVSAFFGKIFAREGPFDCTYAVVELSAQASEAPPRPFLPTRRDREFYVFGIDTWSPTPGPKIEYTGDSGWVKCRHALGEELFQKVANAMEQRGGWWAETSGTVFLYSPVAGISLRMRQGT